MPILWITIFEFKQMLTVYAGGQRPPVNPPNFLQQGPGGNNWSPKPSMADVVKMAMASLMGEITV